MNKKIDLFYNGDYYGSTMQSKTCKGVKERLLKSLEAYLHCFAGLSLVDKQILKNPELLKARISK